MYTYNVEYISGFFASEEWREMLSYKNTLIRSKGITYWTDKLDTTILPTTK